MRRAIVLTALLAAACGSPAELDDQWEDPTRVEFASALGVDLAKMNRTTSGLYWQDLELGEGDSAKVGNPVRIDYTVWLPDGTEVFTTEGGEPYQFRLGYGLEIAGLVEGVAGMMIGGERRLVMSPYHAYGKIGNRDLGIPPLATLVCEVTRLVAIAQ